MLRDWLTASGIAEGVNFRGMAKGGRLLDPVHDELLGTLRGMGGQSLAAMLKELAEAVDSTRRGSPATVCARGCSWPRPGASIGKLADQSRHRSLHALRTYVRAVELCKDDAGEGLL